MAPANSTASLPKSTLDHALDYVDRNLAVFPVAARSKVPMKGSHGAHDAVCDREQVREAFTKHPSANIGISAGKSGLVVLDIDPRHGGDESFRDLEDRYGALPGTPRALTPSGGFHVYLQAPKGVPLRQMNMKEGDSPVLGVGIDTRTHDGGYVVAPPSKTRDGEYTWEVSPDEAPFAPCPKWLIDLLREDRTNGHRERVDVAKILAGVPERERDNELFRLASKLRGSDIPQDVAERIVCDAAAVCIPPFPEREALAKVASAYGRYSPGKHVIVEGIAEFPPSPIEVAELFASRNRDQLRYCYQLRTWIHYDGRRWSDDHAGTATLRAAELAKTLRIMAAEDDTKAHQQIARRVSTDTGIREMLMLAAPHMAVSVDAFDIDPWLFNVSNGTLDLRTGELRPHSPGDMLRKLSPVRYDPEAADDRWERFLLETFAGDLDVIEGLRRWYGYSLTGSVQEEKLFCHVGDEATGKSTLAEAIRAVMGDYAATANFNMFLAKDFASSGPTPELARLPGVRALFSIEVDEGRRLAEGLVKMVTGGGEPIAAAFKYRDEFEYRPQFKLNLIANHAPKVRADDGAMWRRIRTVRYDAKVPEEKRDPALKLAFRNDPTLQAAVLRWCVDGCREWQRIGLAEPQTMRDDTEAYRSSNDSFGEFFTDNLDFDPDAFTPTADIWQAWQQWCAANGEKDTRSREALGKALAALGAKPERKKVFGRAQRGWYGVRVTGGDSFSPVSGKSPYARAHGEVSEKRSTTVTTVTTDTDDDARTLDEIIEANRNGDGLPEHVTPCPVEGCPSSGIRGAECGAHDEW